MSDLVEKLRILYGICRGELRPKTYTPVGDVDVMIEQAADRIEALEAALREIHEAHRDSLDGDKVTAEIARRALEGKP